MFSNNNCNCDLEYDCEGKPQGRHCEGKQACRQELSYFDLFLYLSLIFLFLWIFF